MSVYKKFLPKVDKKRRLILTRFYSGVAGQNVWCYQIHRVTKLGQIDRKWKPLYAFGSDDFSAVGEFKHSTTGQIVKVPKSQFRAVSGVVNKKDVLEIANRAFG